MPYQITDKCLQCGYCINRCPAGAIIPQPIIEQDDLRLQPVIIDEEKCTDCGVCVSEEWWCPAQAIVPC